MFDDSESCEHPFGPTAHSIGEPLPSSHTREGEALDDAALEDIGLVKLYRVTGDEKYLNLARFFLGERGHANGLELQHAANNVGYIQDHIPVVEQREAVVHAVRAMYIYSGMADVAVLTGDAACITALRHIWDNMAYKKPALTAGIGARHEGEAFGNDYELPNPTAYNETCAAIGNISWNHRLFLLEGQAKYYHVLEQTLYNWVCRAFPWWATPSSTSIDRNGTRMAGRPLNS